jgi:hypothetical protein
LAEHIICFLQNLKDEIFRTSFPITHLFRSSFKKSFDQISLPGAVPTDTPIFPHRLSCSLFNVPEYAITGCIVAAKASLTRESSRTFFEQSRSCKKALFSDKKGFFIQYVKRFPGGLIAH